MQLCIIFNDMPMARADLENSLPSYEYRVTTGKIVMKLDVLGVL